MRKDYKTIKELVGPLLMVDCVENVKYDELVEIHEKDGRVRLGKVLEAKDNIALVQLFESADGLQISESKARFLGHGLELSVSPEIIGRVFDGIVRPIDGGGTWMCKSDKIKAGAWDEITAMSREDRKSVV